MHTSTHIHTLARIHTYPPLTCIHPHIRTQANKQTNTIYTTYIHTNSHVFSMYTHRFLTQSLTHTHTHAHTYIYIESSMSTYDLVWFCKFTRTNTYTLMPHTHQFGELWGYAWSQWYIRFSSLGVGLFTVSFSSIVFDLGNCFRFGGLLLDDCWCYCYCCDFLVQIEEKGVCVLVYIYIYIYMCVCE